MEGSHSGLVRSLGKRVRLHGLQEFESLTLRLLFVISFLLIIPNFLVVKFEGKYLFLL